MLDGHPVILHFFSDGGFGMARSLLGRWHDHWRNGQTQQSPVDAIKCIISDGAGLLPYEAIPVTEDSIAAEEADLQKGGKQNVEAAEEKANTNNTALTFFTGCSLNMLMTFGACQAFHEE